MKKNKHLIMLIAFFAVFFLQNSVAMATDSQREKEIKEKAAKILAAPEFSEKEKSKTLIETMAVGVKEIVEKIKEKIKELWDKIKIPERRPEFANESMDPVAAASLKLIGITIIAAAVILVIILVIKNFSSVKRVKIEEDRDILLALKDAELLKQKAFELAEKGDYRQGIRFLYISLLLKLNEADIIKIEKSKTNKQYLNELRVSGFGLMEKAAEFTSDFNKFWYGNSKTDKEHFEYWRYGYDLLIREVSAR